MADGSAGWSESGGKRLLLFYFTPKESPPEMGRKGCVRVKKEERLARRRAENTPLDNSRYNMYYGSLVTKEARHDSGSQK